MPAGRRIITPVLAVWALVWLCPAAALAQYNTAEISGRVTDPQGAVLVGATVTAEQVATAQITARTTDAVGRFLLPALPVGTYTIVVQLAGFKRTAQTVDVQLGQRIELSFGLELGGLSEEITLNDGRYALLQTGTPEVAEVIDRDRVVNLPLNGRQFLQLALLTDNVVIPPGGTRGSALQQAGTLFNVAGQRSGHNIYLLDGVKVTDEYFNNMVVSLSPDAMQEFKITKSQYPAEFGGKAAALVNVVSRSGTSKLHGVGLEFARSSALDAHNYFDDRSRPVPALRQHQFGGSLGGPIQQRRTFFFANYEGQRIRRSITQTFSVPSAALRTGDFSGLAPICDPAQSGTACVPFAGNRIPADRVDPIARAFLDRVPLPSAAGNVQNLVSVGTQRVEMDQASLRIDRHLGESDLLFGRVTVYDVGDDQPFGTSMLNETLVPGFGRRVTTTSTNVALSYSRVFSMNLLNELRFGFLNARGGQHSQNEGVDFAGASGLQGVTQDPRDVGYPQLGFAGLYNTMGDPTSFTTRNNTSFELYENLNVVRGAHQLKFGAYLFHLRFRPQSPDLARGAFTFTGQFTGNAFADFLLGYPTAAQVGLGRAEEDARTTWFHVYAQDDWRVTPRLTVNVGLRSEINTHMTDARNRLSTIDPNVPGGRFVIASDGNGQIAPEAEALIGRIPIPYTTSDAAGWDSSLLRPGYKRFAPRLGFVWRAPGASETVVRGAFGIFLNQWAYSVQQAFARNLPFYFAKNVNVPADQRVPTQTMGAILNTETPGTVGGSIMDWDYRVEYNQTYTLAVQRLLTPRTSIDVSAMASRTVGADSSTVRNVPEPGPGSIAARRPIPALGSLNAIRWNGWGLYHAGTVRLEHRASDNLSITGHYTWSKSMDDASDPGATAFEANLPQDVYDMRAESALSSYDHRHRLVASGTYALPWLRDRGGWAGAIGGDWRVSGIVTLESGAPFTVNLGTDRANIGAGPAQRPDLLGNPNLPSDQRTPERWFDTSAFTLPAPFTFGDAGRNIVFAPGYANVDLVAQKDVRISQGTRLEIRWEVFNLLNRTNFNVPNRVAFTPNFGRIFSANPPRQMQLGLKFLF